MKKIKEFIPYVIIFLVVICVKTFLIAPVQVVGDSMNPTLNDGDLMFLNKAIYKFRDIKRFDIVVLKSVNDPSKFLVKRVIGLPGDVISYENDKLFVNGKEVKEEFDDDEMQEK